MTSPKQTFRVRAYEKVVAYYEVEAVSEDDALESYSLDGEFLHYEETIETLDAEIAD